MIAAQHNTRIRSGFTLVELSIVLVILGLLVGGVLSGQSLIKAAGLRSVTTDTSRYLTASLAFRDKYFALPGDMANATSFWGNAATGTSGGDCTNPESDAGTGTQTCNGDGNGQVGSGSLALRNSEVFRYWQHLANAGLIEGSYSGVALDVPAGSSGWRVAVIGTNIPASRFSKAGYTVVYSSLSTNSNPWTGGDQAALLNWMWIGAATTGDLAWNAVFTPEDLWNIDSKLDDGKPGTGTVRTSSTPATCTTSNVAPTAEYALSSTAVACTAEVNPRL